MQIKFENAKVIISCNHGKDNTSNIYTINYKKLNKLKAQRKTKSINTHRLIFAIYVNIYL